jgi:hypothetical protein
MSKRKEQGQLLIHGGQRHFEVEVEVLVCNRCGEKTPPAKAPDLGWVAVLSDGRGGRNLDFCTPLHVVEYFAELVPPHEARATFILPFRPEDEAAADPVPHNGRHEGWPSPPDN